jgi:hypothetical protein
MFQNSTAPIKLPRMTPAIGPRVATIGIKINPDNCHLTAYNTFFILYLCKMVATVGFEPTEHSTGAFNRVQADSLKPLGHITVSKINGGNTEVRTRTRSVTSCYSTF